MNESNVVRGYGPLDRIIAEWRHNKALNLMGTDQAGKTILDIGCGLHPYFLKKTAFSHKFGVDASIDGNFTLDNIEIKKVDLDSAELPFEDNYFDVITMLAVIEHIYPENVLAVLRQLRRVLKPDGKLIITTPSPWADWLLRAMAKMKMISSEEIDDHKAAYSHSDMVKMMVDAGFEKPRIKAGYFELFYNVWVLAVK